MINVVVIISSYLTAKVNKKSQSNAVSPWDLIFIRFQSDDVLCRIELRLRLLATGTTPIVGQIIKGSAVRDKSSGCPLATDGRYNGTLLLQLGKSLVNLFAVDTCDLRNLDCF
jgi:hypothetical protein